MSRYFIFSAMVFLIFSSCKNKDTSKAVYKNNIIVYLQPYEGVTASQTQYVFKELKKNYPFIEIKRSTALPKSA